MCDYWKDIAANRTAFSDSEVIRSEFTDIWYDTLICEENDLLIMAIFKNIFDSHYDHFVYEYNHLEYVNRVPVLPGSCWYSD